VPAKRHLGQHFLTDPAILGRIADALGAGPGDAVLEIGPGRGALTRALLARGFDVTAIERDPDLIGPLRAAFPALRLVHADALAADWHALARPGPGGGRRIIGNIPYNITSPLIDKALEPPRPAVVVFLVQKEVADRLAAAPGTAGWGALTVGVTAVAAVERLFAVPAGAFRPRPRVDSAVVRLTPRARPLVADADLAGFRRFVTALFGARRKQLVRALRTAIGLPAAEAEGLAATVGVAPDCRAETLGTAAFVALHRGLVDAGRGGV
jgi:16S rRNA (adenine1518-N6/adenine1519-N6)-dimethyltransferase